MKKYQFLKEKTYWISGPINNEKIKKINFKLAKNLIENKNDKIYDLYEYSTIINRVKKGFKDNSKVYLFSVILFFMFISSLYNKINYQMKLIEILIRFNRFIKKSINLQII